MRTARIQVLSDVRSFHVYSTYRFAQHPNCSYLECAQTPGSLAGTGLAPFLRAPVPQGSDVVSSVFFRVPDFTVGSQVALAGFHDGAGPSAGTCLLLSKGKICGFPVSGFVPGPDSRLSHRLRRRLRPGTFRGLQNVPLASRDGRPWPAIPRLASGKRFARSRSSSRSVVLPCPAQARFSCPTVGTFSLDGPQVWTSCPASRVGCDVVAAHVATTTGISMSPERGVGDPQRVRVQFARPVPVLLPAQVVVRVLVA
jgi:hypothetical protein